MPALKSVFAFLFLLFALFAPATAQDNTQTELEEFAQGWAEAFTANDAEKLLGFYEQSEHLEVRASSGMLYSGYETLDKAYKEELAEVKFSVSEIESTKVRVFGETATISFNHAAIFEVLQAESKHKLRVQTVLVVRKSDDKWRIANEVSTVLLNVPRLESIE